MLCKTIEPQSFCVSILVAKSLQRLEFFIFKLHHFTMNGYNLCSRCRLQFKATQSLCPNSTKVWTITTSISFSIVLLTLGTISLMTLLLHLVCFLLSTSQEIWFACYCYYSFLNASVFYFFFYCSVLFAHSFVFLHILVWVLVLVWVSGCEPCHHCVVFQNKQTQ